MDTAIPIGEGDDANLTQGLPVDRNMMIADFKGRHRPRVEKRQRRLLEKIGFIKPFLQEGERILLVTYGTSNASALEQLTTGIAVLFIKRALFVFTSKRVFHIPTTMDYQYRYSIAQIRYPDCDRLSLRGGTLTAHYKNGLKEKFLYISMSERKKVKAVLSRAPFRGDVSRTKGKQHLCPRCTGGLHYDDYTCPHCGLEFKDRNTGLRKSILIPGGGYFYTRHPFLGMGDAVAEVILIFLVIVFAVTTLMGTEGSLPLFLFFSIILVIEKAITIYHTNHFIKEYLPNELPVTLQKNKNS